MVKICLPKFKEDKESKIKLLKQELIKNQKQIDLFIANFNGLSKTVNAKIIELETANERFENDIAKLKAMSESSQEVTPRMIAEELDELKGLNFKPREEQRRIINKYIKKVVIDEDNDNFHVDIFSTLDRFCPAVCVSNGGSGGADWNPDTQINLPYWICKRAVFTKQLRGYNFLQSTAKFNLLP